MHVVILSDTLPPDSPGGAGKVAWQLGQGLIAAGQRVTFVTSTRGPSAETIQQGIRVYALHSDYADRWRAWYSLLNPQTVWGLNRLLRRLAPDIVNAHAIHTHLAYHSLVIGRRAGAATVFTAHDVMPFAYTKLTRFIDPNRPDQCDGWDYRVPFGYNWRQMRFRWNPARNLSIRHTMRYYVDERVAVSAALKQALEANRLPPFNVVHNGVDPAQFEIAPVQVDVLRQRLRLNGRRVILIGGRLSGLKGDRQLLAALRRIKPQVPDVALLVLARPSDYTARLLDENPDLADQIVLGGWLEGAELATAYRLADVVVSPSICFDSFPTVNLEAMAAGTPVVTTCFGGAGEAVIDGETGYVVNPYNIEALAGALARLLTDDALRCAMGHAGQERIRQQFTLQHQAEAMIEVYERALAKRRGTVETA
ncbi:MAG: glycosyltransferase family 4 protein [Chloroflexi bacterium]|nr:glycosyltransferase family 4 protein [Chloroflexota bacterium]